MPRNDPTITSQVRAPRGAVKVNGVEMSGCVEWDVTNNTFNQADDFQATFAVSLLPQANGPDWWSQQTEIEVEIFAGFPKDPAAFSSADLESIFVGRCEPIDYDPAAREIMISGADLTQKLIDTKMSEKYPNNTASEIAEKIAAAAGIEAKVTATTAKAGKYYQIDNTRLQSATTAWDLLTYLAREEGFVVFVRGKTLYFQPKPEGSQEPYLVRFIPPQDGGPPKANATSIKLTRTLAVAKGIKVTVRSWNSKQKKGFTKTAGRGGQDAQDYSYNIPGLTPDQAQARADKLVEELSSHEMRLCFDGPADNLLNVDDVIKLEGTGTAWDQVYYPESISRSWNTDEGYKWSVEAKNRSPESDPAI